jgi:hypothetical protein
VHLLLNLICAKFSYSNCCLSAASDGIFGHAFQQPLSRFICIDLSGLAAAFRFCGWRNDAVLYSSTGWHSITLVEELGNVTLVSEERGNPGSRKPPFISEDTIEMATASLTTAIYHEIWKPRTKYIFSENSKLEYEQKQRKWKK